MKQYFFSKKIYNYCKIPAVIKAGGRLQKNGKNVKNIIVYNGYAELTILGKNYYFFK